MSTDTAARESAALSKNCVKCRKSLDGHRRMKDSKGNYWCYDCGSQDEAQKAKDGKSTMVQLCARCKKPTHIRELVRSKGQYTCEGCAGLAKSGGGGETNELAKKEKQKLLMAVGFLLAGGLLVAAFALGLI